EARAGRDTWGARGVPCDPDLEPRQPAALEEPLVVVLAERRRVDARAVGELHARTLTSGFAMTNQLHATSTPPSIGYACPVTNDASSEHRYSASDATSSGVPMRPIG